MRGREERLVDLYHLLMDMRGIENFDGASSFDNVWPGMLNSIEI
jgi:hypothetical protein